MLTCYRCGQPIPDQPEKLSQRLCTQHLGLVCCAPCATGFAETLLPIVNAANLRAAASK